MRALKFSLLGLFMSVLVFSCQKSVDRSASDVASTVKGGPRPATVFGDYNIVVQVSPDGKVWTYTITKLRANVRNLSHFILDLQNCGEHSAVFGNIQSATVNGVAANLEPNEGWGTGCNPTTTNFVKINFDGNSNVLVLVITFSKGFAQTTGAAWAKAGTSCTSGTTTVPGCPLTEDCSFSQGYFFANGSLQNGAAALWVDGLTIGGVTYSHTDGMNFWTIDRGRGGNQTMNAFFQLGAVRLSEAETDVAADALIIDTYFQGLDVRNSILTNSGNGQPYQFFSLPAVSNGVSKADAVAAGSRIGAYITSAHCP